jgi:hypothetical protein
MKFSSVRTFVLALAALGICRLPLAAQQVQHLTIAQPGGMPGLPVMTGITQLTNGMQLTWDGPSGYYQVFQKSNSLTNAKWLALGKATNLMRTAIITKLYSNAFFRVSGPAPKYAGYKVCITCHLNVCSFEINTPHAMAFNDLAQVAGGQADASCLPCHTVGYGLPTGFENASATPQLENVQCENCHGPAASHAASPDDPTVVPQVEIAAQVCGGCHSANSAYTNPPTFEEWSASGHSAVVPDVLQIMGSNTNNIRTCGVCHSGSARLAMLDGINPAGTLTKDYNVPQTCAVCHDPHATNANPVQLRNPTSSFDNFELTSNDVATVATFTNKYNANTNISLCAQCHNDRGAAWTDTSRAPHHSLQYNMLLATVGELPDGTTPFAGAHTGLPDSFSGGLYATNQCMFCHMSPGASDAGAHNHSLLVNYNACATCHTGNGASLQAGWSAVLSNQVSQVIYDLNQWAAAQTNSLLTNNSAVAWEYPSSDGLTWRADPASGAVLNWSLNNPVSYNGPASTNQFLIATNIMKARFNLYLYLNDGSFGVHNPIYAYQLLDSAAGSVEQELAK